MQFKYYESKYIRILFLSAYTTHPYWPPIDPFILVYKIAHDIDYSDRLLERPSEADNKSGVWDYNVDYKDSLEGSWTSWLANAPRPPSTPGLDTQTISALGGRRPSLWDYAIAQENHAAGKAALVQELEVQANAVRQGFFAAADDDRGEEQVALVDQP